MMPMWTPASECVPTVCGRRRHVTEARSDSSASLSLWTRSRGAPGQHRCSGIHIEPEYETGAMPVLYDTDLHVQQSARIHTERSAAMENRTGREPDRMQ